jgi:hypothetical protein
VVLNPDDWNLEKSIKNAGKESEKNCAEKRENLWKNGKK